MPRVHDIQSSFNAGELSPRLAARLDFIKYRDGLETCENLIILPEGGAERRSGTRYITSAKSSTVKGKLRRFQFSTTQAYVLEFADQAMRFFRHQALITVPDISATITNGTFTSGITDWDNISGGAGSISHDATNGRLNLIPGGATASDIGIAEQDIAIGAEVNVEHVIKFRVIGAPGNKIEFQVGTASGGSQILAAVEKEVGYHCVAFTPTATPVYIQFRNKGTNHNKTVQIDDVSLIDNNAVELVTPWPEADIPLVEGPQSADVKYLFHGNYPTYKLQRYGHTTWSLVQVDWQDGPYLDENDTTTTLLPSAATGLGINLTLSAVTGVNGNLGWQSTDIGRVVRYKKSTSWGWAVIVSITSTTVAVADVRGAFEAAPTAQTTWRLGAWSGTTGYPSCATFFEQRLYAANTSTQPQTLWGSQTDDYENQQPDNGAGTVEADDALAFTLSADDVNRIYWLSAGEDTLAIGTSGGEWIPGSSGEVITPLDITIRRQTKHGSAQIQPIRVGPIVLFVQKAKRKIRELGRRFEVDGYIAPDMTRLAQHITKSGIVEMDYAQEPESTVYVVREDGQLLTMAYRREEDVVGWSRQILGGSFRNDSAEIDGVRQYDDSAETFTDLTSAANSTTSGDVALFPSSEAINDYAAFGMKAAFGKLTFDNAGGTAGTVGEVTWQYWDGTTWQNLSGVSDGTSGFTAAVGDGRTVTWTIPDDWEARILNNGKKLYYVRAIITKIYDINPVYDQIYGQIIGNAVVESVAIIPGDNGSGQTWDSTNRDEVWVLVKRTINGSAVRHIEFFEHTFETGDDQEDSYFLDSMLTYDGTAATSLSGLDHLEGETVGILADGAIVDDQIVTSGQITLDTAAFVAQVGLRYKHKLHALKISSGNPAGTPVGKTKRIYGVTAVVLNSHKLTIGPTVDDLKEYDYREVSDEMDLFVPYFTGEKLIEFGSNWASDPRIVIESDDPVAFTLLALAPEIDIKPLK